jgi:putative transcriptional regulator
MALGFQPGVSILSPRPFRAALCGVVVALLTVSALVAQSKTPEDLATGKLLVMPRDSSDPNFAKSVVLLVEYGDDGAVGLIINRQTTVPLSRALPELKGADTHSEPVYAGGPVGRDAILALLQSNTEPTDAEPVFGKLYLVSSRHGLESALAGGAGPSDLHIYVGYCGWGPGQLESEVRRGSWYIFDGRQEAVFDSDPSTLWSRMIARTEMRIAELPRKLPGLTRPTKTQRASDIRTTALLPASR